MSRPPLLASTALSLLLVLGCASYQPASQPSFPAAEPAPLPAPSPVNQGPSAPACTPTPGTPATDIFLVDMQFDGSGFTFGAPVNVTDQPCYDNQPYFLPDSSGFLYTSNRVGQTDIYRYNLADGAIHQVTDTPESEYSPTVTPDGMAFSVVRVEADSAQRLWRFPLDGGTPTLLLPDIAPVGYHAWGYDNTLGLFVLGDPPSLHVANAATGQDRLVFENIGRSLNKIPLQRAFSFVNKSKPDEWYIDRYDVSNGIIEPIAVTLEGREFHTWMPDGTTVLMADGAVLYAWEPAGKQWTRIADFSGAGIVTITRLAASPDARHLAFVADRPE